MRPPAALLATTLTFFHTLVMLHHGFRFLYVDLSMLMHLIVDTVIAWILNVGTRVVVEDDFGQKWVVIAAISLRILVVRMLGASVRVIATHSFLIDRLRGTVGFVLRCHFRLTFLVEAVAGY